jgi:signal transduction histidine kinase
LPLAVVEKEGKIVHANDAFQKLNIRVGKPFVRDATVTTHDGRSFRLIVTRLRRSALLLAIVLDDSRLAAAKQLKDRAASSLQTFLQSVSHDLRVPLASAEGYAALLSRTQYKQNLGPDGALFLDRLRANIEQTDEMLHHLLELSRIGAGKHAERRVKMKALVEKVIDQLAPRIVEARAQVRISPLPDAVGDELQIRRVFQNLVDNAIKFRSERPPKIEIGFRSGAYFVRDNGVGIPEALQERIWQPFNKLDPNKAGSGIGLSLVKRIVEEHGGKIWLESKPGEGTTFFFELPSAHSKGGAC